MKLFVVLLNYLFAVWLTSAADISHAATDRDYIEIVGSSTVYPFSTAVAEKFGKKSSFKTPES